MLILYYNKAQSIVILSVIFAGINKWCDLSLIKLQWFNTAVINPFIFYLNFKNFKKKGYSNVINLTMFLRLFFNQKYSFYKITELKCAIWWT